MKNLRIVPKALFICLTLVSLQACTPPIQPSSLNVTGAYETSGVVTVPPYTRTIFSTHNF